MRTSLWDLALDTPIIQAPSAAQGLAHEKGEVDTAIGVARSGSIFSISTYASLLRMPQLLLRGRLSFFNYI